MQSYIALLRGINVSGKKKLLMKDLKMLFEQLGYKEVVTYIQSGNIVFKNRKTAAYHLEKEIHSAIADRFGYDVSVLVKTSKQIESILHSNPYNSPALLEGNNLYYVLLKELPEEENIKTFKKEIYENEECVVAGDCAYLVCFKGMGKAKLNNNLLEKS